MELKKHRFEGKKEEELLAKALSDLNAQSSEIYYSFTEEKTGTLFKSKKIIIDVVLKEDLVSYVKNIIQEILKAMGINGNLEIQKKDNYLNINIISDNNSILIGRNGKTIEALQILVRQAILNKINTFVNIIIDVEEYKEKQKSKLEYMAKQIAKDVVRTKKEIKMENMNSYERRVVHSALTGFKGIKTESEGEEPERRVVIKPE